MTSTRDTTWTVIGDSEPLPDAAIEVLVAILVDDDEEPPPDK